MSDDYKALFQQKCIQFDELNEQFELYQQQSNNMMSEMQKQIADLKRKNEILTKELNDLKLKKNSTLSALERQLEHIKKEKNQFQTKFYDFQKKVVELEIINESLESENRASKTMLNAYQQRVEKTMQELALLQTQLQQNKNNNQQAVTRLRNQLKQTQQQLYVVHLKHQKHNDESQHRRSRRLSSASFGSQDDATARIQLTEAKISQTNQNIIPDFKRNKEATSFHKTMTLVNNLIGELDMRVIKIRTQKKKLVQR